MNDLLLSVHVVVKTLNFKISRDRLAEMCAARAARLFVLIQSTRSLFSGVAFAIVFA